MTKYNNIPYYNIIPIIIFSIGFISCNAYSFKLNRKIRRNETWIHLKNIYVSKYIFTQYIELPTYKSLWNKLNNKVDKPIMSRDTDRDNFRSWYNIALSYIFEINLLYEHSFKSITFKSIMLRCIKWPVIQLSTTMTKLLL